MGILNPNCQVLVNDIRDNIVEGFFLGDSFLTPGTVANRPGTKLMNIVGGWSGKYGVRRYAVTPLASSAAVMGYGYVASSPDWLPVDNLGMTRDENALYAVDSTYRWSLPCSMMKFESNSGANWVVNGFLGQNQITPASFMGKSANTKLGASGKMLARILYFGHPSGEMWNRTTRIHHTSPSGAYAINTSANFTTHALGYYQAASSRTTGNSYTEGRLNAYDADYVIPASTNDFIIQFYDSAAYTGALGGSAHGLGNGLGLAFNAVWQDADSSGNAVRGNGLYVAAGASWGLKGFTDNAASSGSTTDLKRYARQQLTDFVDLSIYGRDCVCWFVLVIDWNEEWLSYIADTTAYRAKVAKFITEIQAVAASVGVPWGVCFWLPYYHQDGLGGAVGGGTDAQAQAHFRTLAGVYADFCVDRVCMVNGSEFSQGTLFDGGATANAKLVSLGYSAWNAGGTYGGGDGVIDVTSDWTSADSSDVAADGDLMDSGGLHPNGNSSSDKDEQIAAMVFADVFRRVRDGSPDGPHRSRDRGRQRGK